MKRKISLPLKASFNAVFKTVFKPLMILSLAAGLCVSLASCSKSSKFSKNEVSVAEDSVESASPMMMASAPRMAKMKTASSLDSASNSYLGDSGKSGGEKNFSDANSASSTERKLIKNGDISVEVQNLSNAEKAVGEWASKFGGYIESSYSGETSGSITVRIPAKNFDEAMSEAGNFGTVKSQNISTQDVSERFYDLKTRLESKKVMRERLQKYLSQAKDVKDMLQIERELNSVVTDIESMEGSMARLSSQIDLSTITVSYSLPYRADPAGGSFRWPSFGEGFRHFVSNLVDFFACLLKIVLYIVICGIPVLAVLGFMFWLLFGKIGLVKKIFKKLK